MNKPLLLSLMTAMLFAACSNEDSGVPQQEPRQLTVEVTENPLLDSNGEPKQVMTRTATVTTTATLESFSMNYQDSEYDFTKIGGTWSTKSWPNGVDNDTKIDFYAYNKGTFYWNSGNPYISYVMSHDDGFNQTDFLVATHKDISYNDAGGNVSLDFDHACAAVKFYICKTSGVGDKAVVVKSVVLSGVKYQGDYRYNTTPNWETWGDDTASYDLHNSDITLTTEKVALPCGYLFLIPQSKVGLTLTVNYTVNGGTTQSHDFHLTGSWNAGTEYVVNINMGTSIIK